METVDEAVTDWVPQQLLVLLEQHGSMMNLFRPALSTQRATHYLRPKVHVHLEEVETNKAPKLIILHH